MTSRPLRESDIPILKAALEKTGFTYELPDLLGPNIEGALVIVNDKDEPILAFAAERILQSYLLFVDESLEPSAKLYAIKLMHDNMEPILTAKGYREINCFLPPEIAKTFGRRLVKSFGWVKNWESWYYAARR